MSKHTVIEQVRVTYTVDIPDDIEEGDKEEYVCDHQPPRSTWREDVQERDIYKDE